MPSSEMGDKPLDHAVILDTEDDIGTKLLITCSCGVDLEVSQIRVDPEQPIVLVVHACENCQNNAQNKGRSIGVREGAKGKWAGF